MRPESTYGILKYKYVPGNDYDSTHRYEECSIYDKSSEESE